MGSINALDYKTAPYPKSCAWAVFLLGTASYLPGVLVLAHSLRKYKSRYPLIVAVDARIPKAAIKILEDFKLEVRLVQPLIPSGKQTIIAQRFIDTWTKALVFDFKEFDKVCLIDGDMMLRDNMDELFNIPLAQDQIAASFACVCNLHKSSWAAPDWIPENCAHTPLTHSTSLSPLPSQPTGTHSILNSGLVILQPSHTILKKIKFLLNSTSKEDQNLISNWLFPDQDLLAHIFRNKWISIPWIYNALKTMRYQHGNFYKDEMVKNVHYICKKPWERRPRRLATIKKEGEVYEVDAGSFEGVLRQDLALDEVRADAVTHGWWWEEYEVMIKGLSSSAMEFLDTLVDNGEDGKAVEAASIPVSEISAAAETVVMVKVQA